MKLTAEDIKRIAEDVERRKAEVTERYMRQIEWEAEMESDHSDWGDRD